MSLAQNQQQRRQWFGSLGQPEKSNDPSGYRDRLATASCPKKRTDAAVLYFQRSRIVNQTLLISWQSGLSAQEADVYEHPEHLLEHGHALPPVQMDWL